MSFRVADGFVSIHAEIDKNQIRAQASRAGDLSGEHFMRSMASRVDRDGDIGRKVGRGFMNGILDGMFTPNMAVVQALRTGVPKILGSPFGIAGIAAGALFAASFVGAVISSGISAVVGGLFVGLGALALRENEQIVAAFTRTGRRVDAAFTESAAGLIDPFLEAADDIGDGFALRIAPRLKSIFDDLGPGVGPLTEGLIGTVERLLAQIQPHMGGLTREFLIPFSRQLPRLGESMGNFLATIIRNGPTVARAFEDIVDSTIFLLDVTDDAVVLFTRMFSLFDFLARSTGGLTGWMLQLSEQTNGAAGSADLLIANMSPLSTLMTILDDRGGTTAKLFSDRLPPAFSTTSAATDRFATAQEIANDSMSTAITRAGSLTDALDILSGGALAIRAANRQFEQGIDDLNAKLKEHGLNLDTNTEAGREVGGAIDVVAESVIREADAVFEATRKTDGLKSAQEAATGVLQNGRKTLIDMLAPFFDNRKAAEAYVDAILAIPKQWSTNLKNNAKDARKWVEDYIDSVMDVPRNRTTTFTQFLNEVITRDFGVNAPQANRFGGLYMAANGLLSTSRMFGPGNRTLFGFREPGTGGEAFIARNAPRERSLAIGAEAMRWHRAVVVPMERAATTMASASPTQPAAAPTPPPVRVQVFLDGREIEPRMIRVIDDQLGQIVSSARAGTGRVV